MRECSQASENLLGKKYMDPISNMLIMIKNASLANKDSVVLPFSKLKFAIGECLMKEGYIKSIVRKIKKDQPVLEIELIYIDKKPRITEVERVSKQSRRVYFGMKDIHTVKGGTGLLVLSTPKGILSGKNARKAQVGGEALFRIW
ncbi:MAG: 30S ribosomal protein S8 [Patescibacteria group bacterium]